MVDGGSEVRPGDLATAQGMVSFKDVEDVSKCSLSPRTKLSARAACAA